MLGFRIIMRNMQFMQNISRVININIHVRHQVCEYFSTLIRLHYLYLFTWTALPQWVNEPKVVPLIRSFYSVLMLSYSWASMFHIFQAVTARQTLTSVLPTRVKMEQPAMMVSIATSAPALPATRGRIVKWILTTVRTSLVRTMVSALTGSTITHATATTPASTETTVSLISTSAWTFPVSATPPATIWWMTSAAIVPGDTAPRTARRTFRTVPRSLAKITQHALSAPTRLYTIQRWRRDSQLG